MERSVETASFGRSRYGGAGGKLRRTPARKAPSTPYARPPSDQARGGRGRWISRLVDPAYRLISGNATRILPSFFSRSAPEGEDEDEFDAEEEEEEQDAGSDDNECSPIHGTSRTPGAAGPSGAGDTTNSALDFVRDEQVKNNELSDNAFSEIEQLVKGKSFSRDEIDRLMEIIHSRTVDHPDREQKKEYPSKPAGGKAEMPVVAPEMPSKATEDLNRAVWATSTPLPLSHSTMRDEVGASPIDIARAYMGSRTSETGIALKSTTSKDERPLLYSDDFLSKPSAASPTPKASICWPGATVQDQRVLSTPQSQRRVGLHNFPRTPYSRTIFSKSKSKQPQLQDDSNKRLNIASSPFQYSRTPIFGQAKSRSDAVNDGYGGSVGPIRRIRHKAVEKPPTGSYLRTPLSRPSQARNSVTSEGFLPAVKKNLEPGETSGAKQVLSLDNKPHSVDVGVSAVPRHTSELARIISEHIDRNPVTPKDKSAEMIRATTWKKPQSSDHNAVKPDNHTTTPSFGGFNFHKNVNQIHQMNTDQQKPNGGNSFTRAPPLKSGIEASDANNISSAPDKIVEGHYNNSGPSLISQVKNAQEDVSKTIPDAAGKPEAQSPGRKPNLANISINKSQPQWGSSSNQSAGFTFPVSAASGASSEPPTPTIIPVLSAPKEVATTDPKFEFGLKSTSTRLVFSFPSTSSSAAVPDAAADLKFNFGSDKKRVSFASIKKDGICY